MLIQSAELDPEDNLENIRSSSESLHEDSDGGRAHYVDVEYDYAFLAPSLIADTD